MYKHLRLIVNPHNPWFYFTTGTDCDGIHCHLLKYLKKSLNLTYDYLIVPDGLGIGSINGTWTGWVGHLQRNVSKYIF